LSKALQPADPRRSDADAIRVFREVMTEFHLLASAVKKNSDADGDDRSISSGITAMLANAAYVCRNDNTSSKDEPRQRADAFAAHLIWLSAAPLFPGRGYLSAGAQTIGAMVTELKYRVDIESCEHLAAKEPTSQRDRLR
jgi:bifunctional enzyme CysN/CysC